MEKLIVLNQQLELGDDERTPKPLQLEIEEEHPQSAKADLSGISMTTVLEQALATHDKALLFEILGYREQIVESTLAGLNPARAALLVDIIEESILENHSSQRSAVAWLCKLLKLHASAILRNAEALKSLAKLRKTISLRRRAQPDLLKLKDLLCLQQPLSPERGSYEPRFFYSEVHTQRVIASEPQQSKRDVKDTSGTEEEEFADEDLDYFAEDGDDML